jgi:hypothetical protein
MLVDRKLRRSGFVRNEVSTKHPRLLASFDSLLASSQPEVPWDARSVNVYLHLIGFSLNDYALRSYYYVFNELFCGWIKADRRCAEVDERESRAIAMEERMADPQYWKDLNARLGDLALTEEEKGLKEEDPDEESWWVIKA